MSSVSVVRTSFSREKLLQIARSLPADLQVFSQLGEMLQDVNSDLDSLAALLRRDVALATRIVRISNSPLFVGGGQIASIEEAVNRVGFSEILKLVGTAAAARGSDRALDAYRVSAQQLRDNMLFSALAAEALAKASGVDPRDAYTAGLLRPLGFMVLDRASRGQAEAAQTYDPARWSSYSAWEGAVFGFNHCEVSALILEEWRLPPALVAAIRAQYLVQAGDWELPLAVLLNLANGLAERAGRGLPGEAAWWELAPTKLATAGVGPDDLESAQAAATAGFESALAALSR